MKEEETNEYAIRWFSDVKASELPQLGIKGQRLGLLYQQRFPVPAGCIITSKAHRAFLHHAQLDTPLDTLLKKSASLSDSELKEKSAHLQEALLQASFPSGFEDALQESCDLLNANPKQLTSASASALLIPKHSYELPFLAVRSSPISTSSTLPSFLNVKGMPAVLSAIKQCYASLLTPEALHNHAAHSQGELPLLAIILQTMIDAEISGIITSPSALPATSYTIRATWGLGELLQNKEHTPDQYELCKERDIFTVHSVMPGEKKQALTRDSAGKNILVALSEKRSKQQLFNSAELYALARLADAVNQRFQEPHQLAFSMLVGECSLITCLPSPAPHAPPPLPPAPESLSEIFGDVAAPAQPSEASQQPRASDDIENIILRELDETEKTIEDFEKPQSPLSNRFETSGIC